MIARRLVPSLMAFVGFCSVAHGEIVALRSYVVVRATVPQKEPRLANKPSVRLRVVAEGKRQPSRVTLTIIGGARNASKNIVFSDDLVDTVSIPSPGEYVFKPERIDSEHCWSVSASADGFTPTGTVVIESDGAEVDFVLVAERPLPKRPE